MTLAIDKYDPDLQELLWECRKTDVFAKTFFPKEVSSDFSVLHKEIFDVIDSTWRRKALAAPRGLGKTTIAKIRACKAILFREVPFIIYLSNSAGSAEMQTEAIKRMLQQNEMIQRIFGQVQFSTTGLKDSFSKKSWVAYGDVFVLPRGNGQQVRGLNWMGNRPGLIIVDDLESTELVRSDEQREKLSTWFYSDLMKTEDMYDKPVEILYIDTIKHEAALLQELMDASDWYSKRLSICDDDFNSFDPNYKTTEEIKQEYEEHREKGKTDLFYMEYMNIPISLKDAVFREEYFKYYTEENGQLAVCSFVNGTEEVLKEYIPVRDLITVVICDPARTVKLHSAESAIVVISVSKSSRKIFIRNVYSEKFYPDEMYEQVIQAILLYNVMLLAVEVTGLHEYISQPLENYLKAKNVYPNYIELNAKGDKDQRISSMAPYYRLGQVYHNKGTCAQLENQLIWHPKSKLKDIIDALGYLPKIMDEQYMFFDPEEDDFDGTEYEELELENEELIPDNWRIL